MVQYAIRKLCKAFDLAGRDNAQFPVIGKAASNV